MVTTTELRTQLHRIPAARVDEDETSDLVGFIGHELRTPLASLVACVELLETADDPVDRSRLASTLRRQADRLMLVFDAALQASAETPRARPDCASDVRLAIDAAAEWLRAFDARLTVRTDARDVHCAAIDEGALHLVLNNLALNAVKHGRARAISLAARDRGGMIEIRVEDDGQGVPEHLRARIFERGARDPASDGHGLGLFVARHLVRKHGGDISVECSKLGGAAFRVILPVAEAPHA